MLKDNDAFSGFSVNDMAATKEFYSHVLGLEVQDGPMGAWLKLAHDTDVFMYPKADHEPAEFTVLNFRVTDIQTAAAELRERGVVFELYEGLTDAQGIAHGLAQGRGPDIAWFRDPAGNILSILQES